MDVEPDMVVTGADAAQVVEQSSDPELEGAPNRTQQDFTEWVGKNLIDRDGEKIGKLEDVYFDVETDEPRFGSVKEGVLGRHLTFVPLTDVTIGPDALQVSVSKAQVKEAPNIELDNDALSAAGESALYHHYELNYVPSTAPSGRRLARR